MGYVGQAPADAALTGADITDGIIANVDIASDAAIALSKTALSAGTGVTLSTNTLNVDAAQTGITSIYATDLILGEDSQTAIDFGTANEIDFKINNTAELTLDATALYPIADAGLDLGTTALGYNDLHLGASGVLNFDNANMTITHSTGVLTVAGGTFATAALTGTTIDASTDFTIGDTVITDGVITDTSGISVAANVSLADDKVITLGEAGKIDFGDESPDDNEATGIVFSFIAGATLAIGDVVYIHTDGEVAKADADAVTSMPAVGICVSAGSDGSAVDVLVQGIMHDTSAFDTFTVGADIFVGTTAGAVSATAPSGSGDTVQKVGVALHADMVYFNFNTTEVLLA